MELEERIGGKGGGELGAGCRDLGGGVGAGEEPSDDCGIVVNNEDSMSGAEIKCGILVILGLEMG